MGISIITSRILDFDINLMVGEWLALVLAINKQLTKAISEDQIIQFYINVFANEDLEMRKPCF